MFRNIGKYLFITLICCLFFFVRQPVLAQENTNGNINTDEVWWEQIDDFHANIDVNQDGSFTITETIVYNFGTSEHHGIYRDIPYHYTRSGTSYNVRLSVLAVTNESGTAWPYSTKRWAGELNIKIGDADSYVTGRQTYKITYRVQRAINYFSTHDELYWNLTGNGWIVPIANASVIVRMPAAVGEQDWQLACYTGASGSTAQDCVSSIVDERTTVFISENELSSGEGLTFIIGVPKGIIEKPSASHRLGWWLADNWPLAIPLIVLVVMLYLWYSRGRDPKGKDTVIPIYEAPDHLPAAAIGTVVDEKADIRDISATVIQLAVKGYLKIKEIDQKKLLGADRDYELIKLKQADAGLRDYEKEVLEGIFDKSSSRRVSDMKNKFYVHLKKIKDFLYHAVVQDGYFPVDPEHVRNTYRGIAVLIIVLAGVLAFGTSNVLAGVLTGVSGIVAMILAQVMPRKTMKGVDLHVQIEGFKWFLSVTETERLKFHNAPAKSPSEFEALLPYAMVLGVEKEWAKQFEGIYLTPPEWYEGHPSTAFGAWYLASSLGSMSHDLDTVMVTAPSQRSTAGFGGSGFGGGGFSGGGFGGGGGGSW